MSNRNREGKVIFVGQANTGKTCLLHSLLNEEFQENLGTTINPGFSNLRAEDSSGTIQNMKLWDTSGQERYQSLSKIYFREADVAVVCFDSSEENSMFNTKSWVDLVLSQSPNCNLIFVGTKQDLIDDTKVSQVLSQADSFFENYNPTDIIITSSKTSRNISLLKTAIANALSERPLSDPNDLNVDIKQNKDNATNQCC